MGWNDWIRTVEVEPSIYAADFSRLGEQIEQLLGAEARVFHFDVGDGHFVEPITMGPIVLQSIAPLVHEGGGRIDCHLMVDNPVHHFAAFAEAGADSVTFHYEAVVEASGLAVDDLGAEWPAFRHPKRPEFLLTLPHVHNTAGFFIARLTT